MTASLTAQLHAEAVTRLQFFDLPEADLSKQLQTHRFLLSHGLNGNQVSITLVPLKIYYLCGNNMSTVSPGLVHTLFVATLPVTKLTPRDTLRPALLLVWLAVTQTSYPSTQQFVLGQRSSGGLLVLCCVGTSL